MRTREGSRTDYVVAEGTYYSGYDWSNRASNRDLAAWADMATGAPVFPIPTDGDNHRPYLQQTGGTQTWEPGPAGDVLVTTSATLELRYAQSTWWMSPVVGDALVQGVPDGVAVTNVKATGSYRSTSIVSGPMRVDGFDANHGMFFRRGGYIGGMVRPVEMTENYTGIAPSGSEAPFPRIDRYRPNSLTGEQTSDGRLAGARPRLTVAAAIFCQKTTVRLIDMRVWIQAPGTGLTCKDAAFDLVTTTGRFHEMTGYPVGASTIKDNRFDHYIDAYPGTYLQTVDGSRRARKAPDGTWRLVKPL